MTARGPLLRSRMTALPVGVHGFRSTSGREQYLEPFVGCPVYRGYLVSDFSGRHGRMRMSLATDSCRANNVIEIAPTAPVRTR